jgi:hypothetical protein
MLLDNPVRSSLTFRQESLLGALNPGITPKGILSSSPLQAAALSNGVNYRFPARQKSIKKNPLEVDKINPLEYR